METRPQVLFSLGVVVGPAGLFQLIAKIFLLQLSGIAYHELLSKVLHDVFYQCLVSADLGSLQSADVFANPGDEGEFGTLAHGITRRDPYKPKETVVICTLTLEFFVVGSVTTWYNGRAIILKRYPANI